MSDVPANPTPNVDELLAIEACREAARRYSYGVDRLDVAVMQSAYWPDATDDHGVFVGNAWEFCERVVDTHDRWAWTMHTISNHRVELDDADHARGECYAIAHLGTDDPTVSTFYGRYLDTYERRGTEWRISHRVCVHSGDARHDDVSAMGLDVAAFRSGSFDRPSTNRPVGP